MTPKTTKTTNDQQEQVFKDQIAREIASTPNRKPSLWDRLQWSAEACRTAQRVESKGKAELWVRIAQDHLRAAQDLLKVTDQDLVQEFYSNNSNNLPEFRFPPCQRCGCSGFRGSNESIHGVCKVCGEAPKKEGGEE